MLSPKNDSLTFIFFFFKQKTAYEIVSGDWSSDVCSSDLMREKIRAFAAHHGVGNLYHETLTTFWMRLLEHVASTSDVDLPLWRRINLIVEHWAKRRPVEAHYSRELIRSQAARDKWVPPDRLPIPF